MAKSLIVLTGMLALLLTTPSRRLRSNRDRLRHPCAQPARHQWSGPRANVPVDDEGTGTTYELTSGFVELEPFVGQRVTIEGVRIPSINPLALNVTEIQPADGPTPGPAPDRTATFNFELTVKGAPPRALCSLESYPPRGAGE